MEELLENYTVTEILGFIVLLALALKGTVEFFDWAKKRLKQVFDKDYDEQQRCEKVDQDIDALQQLEKKTNNRLDQLQSVDTRILSELESIQKTLVEHIRLDDQRNTDSNRAYILRFNTELLRGLKHTEEDFIEVLSRIDEYERYCRTHKDYRNNRATSAIDNIKRVYRDRLSKNDFYAGTEKSSGEKK